MSGKYVDRNRNAILISVFVFGTTLLAQGQKKSTIQTAFPMTFYGFIKLDAAYDAGRINVGNYARWVENDEERDDQFHLTVRQTRLGIQFFGPESGSMKTTGKVEIDFYGGGAENKNVIMMRHAFMNIYWAKADLSVLAGQTSDVISPLVPSTINYVVAWWAGNIGYRRPQVRITKDISIGELSRLEMQAAVVRSIGGASAGFPGFQGRLSLSFPFIRKKIATVGFSGHTGREEDNHSTWSINSDITLPLGKCLIVMGEYWMGENLDAYLGGIGQGFQNQNGILLEIWARGGWAALNIEPGSSWHFGLGGSVDDPDDPYLLEGDRSRNMSLFFNAKVDLNAALQMGIEVSYWETDYKGMDSQQSTRVQGTMMYSF